MVLNRSGRTVSVQCAFCHFGENQVERVWAPGFGVGEHIRQTINSISKKFSTHVPKKEKLLFFRFG